MRVSGVLLCAKATSAMTKIGQQFQAHTIRKEYTAILVGNMTCDSAIFSDPVAGSSDSIKLCRIVDLARVINAQV